MEVLEFEGVGEKVVSENSSAGVQQRTKLPIGWVCD
jgi:hypothetical protein